MRTKTVMAIAVFTLLQVMTGCHKQQERVTVVGAKGVMFAANGDKLVWKKLSPSIPDFQVKFVDGAMPCGKNVSHVDVKGNTPGYCIAAVPKGGGGDFSSIAYNIDFYIPPSVLPDPVVPCNMCGSLDVAEPASGGFIKTAPATGKSNVPGAISCDDNHNAVVNPITVSQTGDGSVPWSENGHNDWTIAVASFSPSDPCNVDPPNSVTLENPCYLSKVLTFPPNPPITLQFTFTVNVPACTNNPNANGILNVNP